MFYFVKMLTFPNHVLEILKHVEQLNGKSILVGGAVRNYLLDQPISDWDFEVYGVESVDKLLSALPHDLPINYFGKKFGVIDIQSEQGHVQLSLPRTEVKSGMGYHGFSVQIDPNLSFKEAARRRDFTVNSMGMDCVTQEIIDPFSGKKDLKNKLLRHVSKKFTEDPLRVLRAVQFCSRFNFTLHDKTELLCKSMWKQLFEIHKDRRHSEFKKCFLKSKTPSIGLKTAKETLVLYLFPEWAALVDYPDKWQKTLHNLDKASLHTTGSESQDWPFMLAAACSEMTRTDTERLVKRFTDEKRILKAVLEHFDNPARLT